MNGRAGHTFWSVSSTPPLGAFAQDGSAVSRTLFSALFTECGTAFGTGDGSTTFNVPNVKSRVVVGAGQGSGLTNRLRGATGGEEAHALTAAENGPHDHSIGSHTHAMGAHVHSMAHTHGPSNGQDFVTQGVNTNGGLGVTSGGQTVAATGQPSTPNTGGMTTSPNTGAGSGNTGSDGSGTAHENMPPFVVMHPYIWYC